VTSSVAAPGVTHPSDATECVYEIIFIRVTESRLLVDITSKKDWHDTESGASVDCE